MANEVINFELETDPIAVKVALNAAFDGTTQTGLKAESANSANESVNVTTNINGNSISNIFENDGITVKNATIANAAKGDTRFQISGNVVTAASGISIPANSDKIVQPIPRRLLTDKKLIIKNIGWYLNNADLRLKVSYYTGSWVSDAYVGEALNLNYTLMVASSDMTNPITNAIIISVRNVTGSSKEIVANSCIGWWLDLAIEDA